MRQGKLFFSVILQSNHKHIPGFLYRTWHLVIWLGLDEAEVWWCLCPARGNVLSGSWHSERLVPGHPELSITQMGASWKSHFICALNWCGQLMGLLAGHIFRTRALACNSLCEVEFTPEAGFTAPSVSDASEFSGFTSLQSHTESNIKKRQSLVFNVSPLQPTGCRWSDILCRCRQNLWTCDICNIFRLVHVNSAVKP